MTDLESYIGLPKMEKSGEVANGDNADDKSRVSEECNAGGVVSPQEISGAFATPSICFQNRKPILLRTSTTADHYEIRPHMETAAAGGVGVEDLSSSSPVTSVSRWTHDISRKYQHLLDKSTPHILNRWIGFFAIAFIYIVRVYFVQGFYIVSYGLGIYILNLLIGFLSPQVDPEIQELVDGPTLPTRGSDEFRPFVRRLPEFKFWYSITKAFCIAFVMTFFSVFDVPVFWPILLFYWMVLFTLTMRRQIMHMIKYKYVPFSFGKQVHGDFIPLEWEDGLCAGGILHCRHGNSQPFDVDGCACLTIWSWAIPMPFWH
ncbi:Protein RER1A [Vitis vinifera]|uniref:Protein RER1A n=1 Tax=Vitis vinifera TaxID=29760 RepID=A0A438FBC9_VITVI|nr:Protein RER1A [Vitis vinifera]RVX23907.1 Protein RER1A [Vitis vinifera]